MCFSCCVNVTSDNRLLQTNGLSHSHNVGGIAENSVKPIYNFEQEQTFLDWQTHG